MDTILLVDGSNLLFQMFFGMPARIVNAEGKAIQGTLGFVGALLKMIRMVEPTHVAVLFDGEHANERTELDADYKANRIDYSEVPEEESPFSQLPDIYRALDVLGIVHTETTDCETDDWMAGYAVQHGKHDCRITIASFDSDFFQLITDNVSILRYRGEKSVICDPAYLEAKFGICPEQYADFKALTGDPSDNIKGAEKVGPKTAAALLKEYGTLEAIIESAAIIRKPSIRESILRNTERLRRNYRLIKLNGCEILPYAIEEMRYRGKGLTTMQVLRAIGLR